MQKYRTTDGKKARPLLSCGVVPCVRDSHAHCPTNPTVVDAFDHAGLSGTGWSGSRCPRRAKLYVIAIMIAGASARSPCLPARLAAAGPVRRARARVVPVVAVEGQSPDPPGERFDAVGLVRRESHRADAAGPRRRLAGGDGRRLDAVHRQGQVLVSALSHGVQRRGRSRHHGGGRPRLRVARRGPRAVALRRARPAADRDDRDLLRVQHRPRRRARLRCRPGSRCSKIWREDFLFSATSFTVVGMAGAAAAVVVARGHQWAGAAGAGAGVPGLQHLFGVRRPARGRAPPRRGPRSPARRSGRRAAGGPAVGAGARRGEGAARRDAPQHR